MATRIIVNGRTVWADADFRKQATERRVLRNPVEVAINNHGNTDIDGNPLPEYIETHVPQSLPVRRIFHGLDENKRPLYSYRMIDAVPNPVHYEPNGEGAVLLDPDENITYRRVQEQDPREGWATSKFYRDFWNCEHETLLKLVRRGLVDASIRQGSGIRRYRPRDNRLVLESGLVKKEGCTNDRKYNRKRRGGG